MRFKAVIFDLDCTLYDEFDFVKGGYKSVASYLSNRYACDPGTVFSDMLAYYEKTGRTGLFDYIVKSNYIREEGVIEKMLKVYRMHTPSIKLYDDAAFLIDILKRRKIKIGLITDGIKCVQESKAVHLGLDKIIDKMIFTDDLGPLNSKPSEKPFRLICEDFGIEYADSCYVGDNPYKDFYAPNRLNMTSIRLNRGIYKDVPNGDYYNKPNFTITSLEEIDVI